MNIESFLQQLDELRTPVNSATLEHWLTELEASTSDLDAFVRFDRLGYQRNIVHRNEHAEVLLLCFEAGQKTPIHDHAGSSCAVKVIQGSATETSYVYRRNHWLFATETHEANEGSVVSSTDLDVHEMANLQQDSQRLVTLHVYSPPLQHVGNYSLLDNSVTQVRPAENELVRAV